MIKNNTHLLSHSLIVCKSKISLTGSKARGQSGWVPSKSTREGSFPCFFQLLVRAIFSGGETHHPHLCLHVILLFLSVPNPPYRHLKRIHMIGFSSTSILQGNRRIIPDTWLDHIYKVCGPVYGNIHSFQGLGEGHFRGQLFSLYHTWWGNLVMLVPSALSSITWHTVNAA